MVIRGMFTRLDKRSVYVDSKTVARNRRVSVNHTSQIGVIARRDKVSNDYVVAATVKDSPADRAGLKVGDVLVELRRTPPEGARVAVKGLANQEFNDLFVGPRGTRVDLVVRREGKSLTFHLTYEVLKLDMVLGHRRGATTPGTTTSTARASPTSASRICKARSDRELKKVLAELTESGLNGLVLDLATTAAG